jgi:hypothetical protein
MVLTVSFALSLVTGLFVTIVSVMRSIIANLTPASGRQDHTTSPSASSIVRLARCRVHRIPHPTFVTIAKRPSCGCGTAPLIELILPNGEAKSFCRESWTQIGGTCPTGKSSVGVLRSAFDRPR